MGDFKKLIIWQQGMRIVNEMYNAARFFPEEEKYGMRSQSTRAAVSIPSNIAEGCAKRSQREYKRYVEISLGSSFELETNLLVIKDRKWFPEDVLTNLMELVIGEQKMLSKFIDKL